MSQRTSIQWNIMAAATCTRPKADHYKKYLLRSTTIAYSQQVQCTVLVEWNLYIVVTTYQCCKVAICYGTRRALALLCDPTSGLYREVAASGVTLL